MTSSPSLPGTAARAGALGFTAGLRSQMPLAALTATATETGPAFLRKRFVPGSVYLSAAGEAVMDKLPITPSRIGPGPLSGRLMFGSTAGALLSRRSGSPVVAGLLLGGAGALAGSYAGYHARSWLVRNSGLPDVLVAGLEDVIALSVALLAARN